MGCVNNQLAAMVEIDRHLGADCRLNLAVAPVGSGGIAHKIAGYKAVQAVLGQCSSPYEVWSKTCEPSVVRKDMLTVLRNNPI